MEFVTCGDTELDIVSHTIWNTFLARCGSLSVSRCTGVSVKQERGSGWIKRMSDRKRCGTPARSFHCPFSTNVATCGVSCGTGGVQAHS